MIGIELLGDDCWKLDYDLCLELHNAAAKSAYCLGNVTCMDACVESIFKNALHLLHTLEAIIIVIKCYNDKRKFQDALDAAISILDKIGENVNYAESEEVCNLEVEKVKGLLKGKSHDEILRMKEMKDEYKLATMSILGEVFPSLLFVNPQMFFRMSLRMVALTLENGVSTFSSFGFSALGSALCYKDSYRIDNFPHHLGKLSLALLENAHKKELVPW